jgi:thioredoxin reductase (NADPH)
MSSEPANDNRTRVAIVGGGPIGIELAVALSRRGVAYQVFEAGSIGHTISWWAPQTRWFSSNERIAIAGVPLLTPDQSKANREQYLTYLRSVVTQFDVQIQTHTRVTGIRREPDGFHLSAESTGRTDQWLADAVVLAIGGTDFPKPLGVPGESLPHVDGYLRETHRYFGRRVLIIGGRNSAIEAALRLHHAGADVSLSYRGAVLPEDGIKYWLLPEIKGLIAAGRINGLMPTIVQEILPDRVRLRRLDDGSIADHPADDVLSLVGYEQDKSLFRAAGVQLEGESLRPVYDQATMETNVPGIYVAGTATAGTQSSKYKTFLENCHDHVDKIAAHLTGSHLSVPVRKYSEQISVQPES